jgi:lipopolysaccharide/colanic/teichoic acid biosynthesis glycosyltransferase
MLGNVRSLEPRRKTRKPSRRRSQPARVPEPITPYHAYKRLLDVFIAVVAGLLLAPIVAVAAVLIVITSPGPAFYTQIRLGRFGRPFAIWKLRTMVNKCEEKSGACWSLPGDRRVTPIGRILRRLHIDEFPQLWNVLRGEMSLVGPRPERPEFFPILSDAIPEYSSRLRVKPGVTGLAQVYLPPDEDLEGVRRKQLHDLYYIRHMGPGLDLRLMLATVLQAIGIPHTVVRPLLWLPGPRAIEGPFVERSPVPRSPKPVSQTVS